MHKLCGCICSLVLQQWASFASKQKGLGAIALGKDQPGDANGDACLQIPRRACCMCCVTLRRGLLFEDPKIQVGDMKPKISKPKSKLSQKPIAFMAPGKVGQRFNVASATFVRHPSLPNCMYYIHCLLYLFIYALSLHACNFTY